MKKMQIVLSLVLIAAVENVYAGKKDRKDRQDNVLKAAAFKKESGHSIKEKNRNNQQQISEGLEQISQSLDEFTGETSARIRLVGRKLFK